MTVPTSNSTLDQSIWTRDYQLNLVNNDFANLPSETADHLRKLVDNLDADLLDIEDEFGIGLIGMLYIGGKTMDATIPVLYDLGDHLRWIQVNGDFEHLLFVTKLRAVYYYSA